MKSILRTPSKSITIINMRYGLLLAALTLASCTKESETKPVIRDIEELVFASGQIEWQNTYALVAETDGILQRLDLEIGDEVHAGAIVGEIDNPTSLENLKTAQRQVDLTLQNVGPTLDQIRQNIRFAEQKYQQDKVQRERYERLLAKQSVSRQEFENTRLAEENSLAQLQALQDQLKSARVQSEQSIASAKNQKETSLIQTSFAKVKVSTGGRVIKKEKQKGDFVRRGDVIARLADQSRVEVVLNVDETSIGKVKIGQTVFIRLNTQKDSVHRAKVTEILSAFDEEVQSFVCKAVFENPALLPLYGTQLEGNILVGQKKNVLLVPRNVVGYGNTVRVKDKKEMVKIKTGIVSTDYVEVVEGLSTEDIVLPQKP
jgi:multidrug efflux pump subunit AcrA (membrane-fusion protein)